MISSLYEGDAVRSRRIIYTPSPFAKTNLIYLQETGTLTALKQHISKRDNLSSFLFFTVTEGCGTLDYNGICKPMKKGDCAFVDCRHPYRHSTSDNLWTLKWVHFYGPNMQSIYEKYLERGGRACFTPKSISEYEDILDKIYMIASSSQHIKDMKIYEQIVSLLTLLMQDNWRPGEKKKGSVKKQNLQNVKEYMDQHYNDKITLDMLSDMFFINKYYLTRVFKEQFGITISGYLLQIRITHAKQMLRFTDHTIDSISRECGMQDANYFSRMFKKVEGCTPGEYRHKW